MLAKSCPPESSEDTIELGTLVNEAFISSASRSKEELRELFVISDRKQYSIGIAIDANFKLCSTSSSY